MVLKVLKAKNVNDFDNIPCLDDIVDEEEVLDSNINVIDNFSFTFSMLNYNDKVCEEESSSGNLGNRYRLDLEKYEQLKYLQYTHEYLYSEIKRNKKYRNVDYCEALIDYLRGISIPSFEIVPGIKKYFDYHIEKQINKLPIVKKLLKPYKKTNSFPQLDLRILCRDKEFVDILKTTTEAVYVLIKDYVNKSLKENPKKNAYTQNLHWMFDLLGIKNKKFKSFVEAVFLTTNMAFQRRVGKACTTDNICKRAGLKDFNILNFEYESRLFLDSSHLFELVSEDNNIIISCFIYAKCIKQYISKEDFIKEVIVKGKDTDLTAKDFYFVKQYEYIKSLLEQGLKKGNKGINILIYGAPGGGKTALSRVLIKDLNAECYEIMEKEQISVAHNTVSSDTSKSLNNNIRINQFKVTREILKTNYNCVLLYDEAEDFFRKSDEQAQSKAMINKILEENETPVIWTTNSLYCMESSFLRRFSYTLNMDELPADVYIDIVTKLSNKYNVSIDEDLKDVCITYRPNIGLVEKAFKNSNLIGNTSNEVIKQELIDSMVSMRHGEKLDKLVSNKFTFNPDLLNTSENLKELVESIKRTKRLDFSMLLYGVPGSSKTSFARYIAKELGLKVISKTYTELSSMWVGETEKNVKNLFDEAERDKALIILDEADVLLQDRTRAMRSWEISQTEALLTAMEFHPYPFIMTTNLYENLDPAVMRRILYKVKHDYLTNEQVKLAFKYFFNVDINENLHLSRLTSGDFAVIKKQADFQGKLNDKEWLIEKLTEEMNQKKMFDSSKKISF